MSNVRQWYAIKHKLEKQGRWNYSKRPRREAPKRPAEGEGEEDPLEGPSWKYQCKYGTPCQIYSYRER